ncbi:MAG: hypothetical protein FWF57_03725 [Defluviitaleaceae bacterium]|nr:hypothetical protein [Defluviitaleaceae bacterium]
MSTQSRSYIKHDFIEKIGVMFGLTSYQIEELANKAGLTLCVRDREKIHQKIQL